MAFAHVKKQHQQQQPDDCSVSGANLIKWGRWTAVLKTLGCEMQSFF